MAYSIDDAWDSAIPVVRAGNAAFGVYVRCGAWSARNSQDGFVPAEVASGMGSPELSSKLVAAGLWEVVDGGFRAVHFLERNESAEQKRRRLDAEAKRKADWRARQKLSTPDGRGDRRRTSHGTSGRSPALPLPPPKGGKGARESDATPCPAHPHELASNCRLCASERKGRTERNAP